MIKERLRFMSVEEKEAKHQQHKKESFKFKDIVNDQKRNERKSTIKKLFLGFAFILGSLNLKYGALKPLLERDVQCIPTAVISKKEKVFCIAHFGSSEREKEIAKIVKEELTHVKDSEKIKLSYIGISDGQGFIYDLINDRKELVAGLYWKSREYIYLYDAASKNIRDTLRHELVHAYFNSLKEPIKEQMFEKIKTIFDPFYFDIADLFTIFANDDKWQMFLEEVKGIIKTQQYQIDENAFFKSLEFLRSYAYYIDIGYGFVTIDVADEILARMMGNKDVHPAFLSFYKGLFDDEILEEAINRNGINEHDMKNIEKIDRQTAHKIVVEALKKIKENKKL